VPWQVRYKAVCSVHGIALRQIKPNVAEASTAYLPPPRGGDQQQRGARIERGPAISWLRVGCPDLVANQSVNIGEAGFAMGLQG